MAEHHDSNSELNARLILRYLEDELLPAEESALAAALESQPECRRLFTEIATQRTALTRLLANDLAAQQPSASIPKQARRLSSFGIWALAASVLLVGIIFYGGFAYLAWDLRAKQSSTIAERDEDVIQEPLQDRLSQSPNVLVHAGEKFNLTSNTIEQQLERGARLVIEGPAEWTIDGDNSATLQFGKLVAMVSPSAIGFSVDTPGGRVIDRGTEFGVQADKDGHTEVHVFRGSVDWNSIHRIEGVAVTSQPRRLVAGEAISTEANNARDQNTKANPSKFIRAFRARQARDQVTLTSKALPASVDLPVHDTLQLWLDANKILHSTDANPAAGEVLVRWANQANATGEGTISDALPINNAGSPTYLSRTPTRLAGVRFTGDQEEGQCLEVTCREPLPTPYTIFVTAIILGNSQSNATDVLFDSPDPLKSRVAMGINPTGLAHDAMYLVADQSAVVSAPWKRRQWQTWQLYEAVFHPDSVELLVNGKSIAKHTVTAGPLNKLWFGSRGNGKHFLNGVLSEVLVYGSALSPVQRTAVEQYSRNKWGIGME